MGDEAPLRIDQIGLTPFAHLDLGDHVPDELEIDLGDAYAGVAAGAGERQRHVRLRLPAKIDGSVVDLVRNRFSEFWILGEVGLAGNHIHRKPRHPQLLVAGGVELRQLRDRGHLTQEPQAVEAPLIDGAGGPRELRGPPHLALDLLDELADLGCRRLGLLALDADQGGLVLLKGKPDLGQSVRKQSNTDEGQRQPDIFAKQPSAHPWLLWLGRGCPGGPHSITSSARASTVVGISRPIALAVFRLMTNSNVTGCAIGRSSGLVPRRILSVYSAPFRNNS